MLSEQVIALRLPVWAALSDVFRDTETTPDDYRWIAGVLEKSGLPRDELVNILFDEVAPAFYGNLLSIAGNWTGWTDEYVREQVLKVMCERNAKGPAKKWKRDGYIRDEWRKIEVWLGA